MISFGTFFRSIAKFKNKFESHWCRKVILKLKNASELLEACKNSKCQTATSTPQPPRAAESVSLRWVQEICISSSQVMLTLLV